MRIGDLEITFSMTNTVMADLATPPMPGQTDDKLIADARAAIEAQGAEMAFSDLDEGYFECYALDPAHAYGMYWLRCHVADLGGLQLGQPEADHRLAMGVGDDVTDTGRLAVVGTELKLRRDDGAEWALHHPFEGALGFAGDRVTVKGKRTGYDVLTDWKIATS